jgi:hypothetical protein
MLHRAVVHLSTMSFVFRSEANAVDTVSATVAAGNNFSKKTLRVPRAFDPVSAFQSWRPDL